jgi:uncharacterized protein YbjT (DUF2867 family)
MILVTGSTGHVGREVVRQLLQRGEKVRALIHDRAKAGQLPAEAEIIVGELENPRSMRDACEGCSAMFLLAPGIDIAGVEAALGAARQTGIDRLVYLSSYAVGIVPMPAMGQWHQRREALIRAASVPATFLRPCGFMTNTLDWLPTLREGGYVLDPVGPGRAALIDPADIASVATVALTEDGHQGEAYTLTGSQSLTVAEQVAVIASATGRKIVVRDVASPEEAVKFRYPNGAPPALAAALVEGLKLMRADTEGLRTDAVLKLTGRPPRLFTDWCAANAEIFRRGMGGGN